MCLSQVIFCSSQNTNNTAEKSDLVFLRSSKFSGKYITMSYLLQCINISDHFVCGMNYFI